MANSCVTHRKCDNCPIITKGIWRFKELFLCYKCYQKFTHRMPANRYNYNIKLN